MFRLVAIGVLLLVGCGQDPPVIDGPARGSIPDPESVFFEITQLPLPGVAEVIAAKDTHSGFHGDGELYLVYQVLPETIEDWLAGAAPWGEQAWKQGPVPQEISSRCLDAPTEGMDNKRVWYVAQDGKQADIPWHNGRLLVLDPPTGRVVLSCWDF